MATSYPHWVGSQVSTITSSSQKFTTALAEGTVYVLSVSVACWFSVAVTGGAAAVSTAGSHFLAAGSRVQVSSSDATSFVHLIKDTGAADGRASLSALVVP